MPRKFDFLSPGIEITEVDQSILPAEVDADGPVIIGRFRKGPGMKPAKVRSLEYFLQVYGNPVPGGSSLKGDIWRDGPQLSAPTYAAYAAQSWLASRTSPVNIVRLLGDQHPQATEGGKAGWQVSGSGGAQVTALASTNSTAYGLFVADLTNVGQHTAITLSAHASFDASDLETDGTTLMFFRSNDVTTKTKAAGLVLEIDFESDNATIAGGTVERALDGTDGVAKITCGFSGLSTITEILAVVEAALELAVSSGDISNISVDNTGTTLVIHNLQRGSAVTDRLTITDKASSQNQFQASGIDPQDGSTAETVALAGGANANAICALAATTTAGEGTLAAVFYINSGYMVLKGKDASGGTGTETTGVSEALIKSNSTGVSFQVEIFNAAGTSVKTQTFNFDRTSGNYIRNVFNTNPQLVNSDVTETDDLKNYWLGETFERSLKEKVTSTTLEGQVAALIPLHKDDVSETQQNGNWGYHRAGSAEAKSGYLIGRNYGSDDSKYTGETSVDKLFRFESLHAGEEIQKSIIIGIEDLKEATNPTVYPYGTFTVKIMDVMGGTLEKYSGCNLDPNSLNFVARRIGDMYMEWNESDRRYRSYGNHPNISDYVRIKMYREEQNYDSTDLPVGFLGPGRPKGFGALKDDAQFKSLNLSDDFAGAFVTPSVSPGKAQSSEALELYGLLSSVKFTFPKLPLRVNGSDGFSSNPYKAYFGIRPKVDANSSLHDPDYGDYVRALPAKYAGQIFEPSGDFEYSCVFSLHDIVIDTDANTVTWTSGSMKNGTSYTSNTVGNSLGALFDLGVKQFALPLFGGSDGLDITEKEPFREALIGTTLSETQNYLQYSINKAIDSISDAETVPASLLAVPGVKNAIITSKVIQTAEARKDMLAVIDLKGDYTPSYESKSSQSERLGSVTDVISNLKNRQLDSSYAAAYFPAVQIQDNLNNSERVWVPASVAGLGAMAQSDAASELWFAPAGFNRGGLGNLGGRSGPRVIQARQRLDVSERDKLYEVNINPIATFPNEGVVIFGQKTLQQTPSALDRINVRRLMIYLKAEIGKVARSILFDNNVRSTWSRFTAQAEPILSDVKAKFGLTEYRLILDSSTTTADLIDRNIMYAKVFLKPARAIEFIAIDFVITRTGAEFA